MTADWQRFMFLRLKLNTKILHGEEVLSKKDSWKKKKQLPFKRVSGMVFFLFFFPENPVSEKLQSKHKTLRKHAYSNILKSLPPKNENFQIKKWLSYILHISDQNIDCGYSLEPPRRGGSNEYPQSMFLSRNKKNNVYPCKPQFYYIKVGFKGAKII